MPEEFVGQQVGEAGEYFPSCGCGGETTIEAGIEHEVFAGVVVQRPQIAYGIAAKKRLREMPDFSGEAETFSQRMGNRKRLAELGAVNGAVEDFVKEEVGVVVKAFYVCAGEKEHGVSGVANIEAGCPSVEDLAYVAYGDGWVDAFALVDDSLKSKKHASGSVVGLTLHARMHIRSYESQ